MGYPTVTVSVDFTGTPYTTGTWVDITSYVRSMSVRRGRTNELENFEAGTARIVLDNRDRRFDPFYTSGPYYGNLKPRTKVRIDAQATGGSPQSVFEGFVSGWPVELAQAGFDSTVTLECFDVLGLIAEEELPDNLSGHYIQSLNPRHYWPLDDPLNPTNNSALQLVDKGSSPTPLKVPVSFVGNADGLAPGLPNTSLVIAAGDLVEVAGKGSSPPSSNIGVSIWYQQTQPDFSIVAFTVALGSAVEAIYDATVNTFTLNLYEAGTQRIYRNTSVYLDMSVPHHFAVSYPVGGIPTVWIDGIQFAMTFVSSSGGWPLFGDEFILLNGRYQDAAVFASTLTTAQVQTIYNLAANRVLETTSARFTRILGYLPGTLNPAPTFIGTAAYKVFDIGAGGPPVLQELQLLADSEGGNLYVTKNGRLTMTSRNSIFSGSSLTSQATFGTGGISIGPIARYRFDAESLRNQLAVGYTGDGTVEVTDTASVTAYGTSGGSLTTYLSSVDEAEDLGDLLVGFQADPTLMIDPVEVNPAASDAAWATILNLELLDRITLVIPQKVGSNLSTQQLIQAIEHQITPGEWTTTITGSTRFTNPFIIGQSLLGGPDLLI